MEPESRQSSGLTSWLAANRNQGGLILMIAGIVLAALPVWIAAQYGTEFLGIEIITGLVAALLLFAGVGLRFRPEGSGSPMDEARLTVLGLGGLIGLCVAILGILLNIQWWDFLTRWLRFGERDGAWKVLLALAMLIAGLAIMFVSLASVRSEERSSPVLRRLIYGYNAVLSGILLLLILIVINTLAFVKLPAMIDSTETGMFKINERSKQILRGLQQPTTVYLLMATESLAYDEMRTLLGNAEEYAPKLRVETLSTGINAGQIRDLQKEHPEITSNDGVLIVYGDEKGAPSSFIKIDEIMKTDYSQRGERSTSFEGESRLITELAFLSENKQKLIIYFANGNAGEFDINDTDPTKATGIGTLKARLEKRNFDVRALKFDLTDPKVPDDAQVVVVPNPQLPYSPQIVGAFAKYLNERKGKLIALFDVPVDQKSPAMPVTGLESLLASFQVDLSKERVLSVPGDNGEIVIDDPESTLAVFSRSAANAKNPIALAFRNYRFLAEHPRVVRPIPPNPAGPASFRAETLVETRQGILTWAEPDVATSPRQLIEAMRQDRALARKKLTGEPLSLAVTVSESSAPPMGGAGGDSKPRMAVFGFASFITNPRLDETRGVSAFFDFFAGTLDWLREKATNIGIEPRQYKNYMLEQSTSAFRLVFLPGILALVCIVGLGAGVWVVRRR